MIFYVDKNNTLNNTDNNTVYCDSISYALNNASSGSVIHIAGGTYEEKLTITTPNLTIIGDTSSNAIITGCYSHSSLREDGSEYGTTGSAVVTVSPSATSLRVSNITIENSFKRLSNNAIGEQAVALKCEADKCLFEHCRFISGQDTLYADARDGSLASQVYRNCFITGDIDFVFGRARALFDNCTLVSKYVPLEDEPGFICAPSTYENNPCGFIFNGCRFIAEYTTMNDLIYLARPWQPGTSRYISRPMAVFIECYMGRHIKKCGYCDMGDTKASDARFYEYRSYGPGAHTHEMRRSISADKANALMKLI